MRLIGLLFLMTSITSMVACAGLTAPLAYVDGRLQRDDAVALRNGIPLSEVAIGEPRKNVHDVWGEPRPTQPRYPDFDLYLGVQTDAGEWRVLPGNFQDLKHTTPTLVQVRYRDEHVDAIYLFARHSAANSRFWCDEAERCGELFFTHSDDGANPLVMTTAVAGYSPPTSFPSDSCELVVFPDAKKHIWPAGTDFLEVVLNEHAEAYVTQGTFLVMTIPAGLSQLQVWPGLEYSGAVYHAPGDGTQPSLELRCHNSRTVYVEIGSEPPGFWPSRAKLVMQEVAAAEAQTVLAKQRAITRPLPVSESG